MALRDRVRRFADALGLPSFAGTPYADGKAPRGAQGSELGGSGTFNFGGFIRGEDFNPEMDSLTAIANLDIMRRSDAQTNAALSVIMQPIRSAEKRIDAVGDKPLDKAVAEFVEWNLFSGESIIWDDFLRQALLMLVFGHYVFEKVWAVQQKGRWAGHLYYKKLAPRPPKTIWQWFTDENGELISIKQLAVKAGTYQFLDIPSEKLVIFVHNKEGDNYAGTSILRSAYPHWMIKNNLYIVDAIRAVRFGAGIPKAKLLKGYSPNTRDRDNLANTLMGMSSHQLSYIIEPEDVEISILVPQGAQGGAQIIPTINHHNEMITRNVMATFLDMGGRSMGGSNALGSSAMDFFTNAILSESSLIEDVVAKQLIVPLVDANFDIEQLSGYPKLKFNGIKQDKLKDVADIVTSLANAGMKFTDLETQNTFRAKLDLPELSEEDVSEMPDGGPGGDSTPTSGAAGVAPNPPSKAVPSRGARPATQDGRSATAVNMRPVAEPSGKATSIAVDHTADQEREASNGKTAQNAKTWDGKANVATAERPSETAATTRTPSHAVMQRSENASSGAADEEGHTSTEDSRIKSRPRVAVSTTDPETTAVQMSEMPEGAAFWRDPTPLESRVLDLKETPRRLNSVRDALLGTLRAVREEQILRVAEAVAHQPVGATPPTPPLVGKLVSDALEILQGVFKYGYQSVETELRKQGAERLAGPLHHELQFADGHEMPWAVELSPVTEPSVEAVENARVEGLDVDSLIATQTSLSQRRVLPEGMDTSLPIIVRQHGLNYIYDGHHRLVDAKANGAKKVRVKVVRMREMAFASPKHPSKALPHLEASVQVKIQSASDRLVSSAVGESLRLKRAGWTNDEIEEALKIHLGELSDADLQRISNMSTNEAVSLGRTSAAEVNADQIGSATYSALMDNACCEVCESLDQQEFDLSDDEYEENMPPNPNCKGGDACRCTYIYTFAGKQMVERSFGGPGSGWFASAGHVSSKDAKGLKKASSRLFKGTPQEVQDKPSKLETGKIGEKVAAQYLAKTFGKDVVSLNPEGRGNNFPVDLLQHDTVYEVKAGLVSNGKSAQHWRATIGEPGPREAAALEKMSDAKKASWNDKKSDRIIERKWWAVNEVKKELGGKAVKAKTIGLILHPGTRTADVHVFNGFHARIAWNSSQAKGGYVGTYKY